MKAKREAHVELARILACMIVVGVHVCLPQIVMISRIWEELLFLVFWRMGLLFSGS